MFTESVAVRRINNQCRAWVQKTTGKRCTKGMSNGAVTFMHPISGPPICVTNEDLNNSELWSQV